MHIIAGAGLLQIRGLETARLQEAYPGEAASAEEVFRLAESYREAAAALKTVGRPREPLSRAPFRLAVIHAIELYLNAFLLKEGLGGRYMRTLRHDLGARAVEASARGLRLRVRTAAHLVAMAEDREYLVIRYETTQTTAMSQINRLQATLEELRTKVSQRLHGGSMVAERPKQSNATQSSVSRSSATDAR